MRIILLSLCLALCCCDRDMDRQARVKPLGESDFFPDGMGARLRPAHTVSQRDEEDGTPYSTGLNGNDYVESVPVQTATLIRGRERYGIYCAACHGATGNGDGMVVQRGFPRPQSFHGQRLREAPAGYLYDVIRNGYGAMAAYSGLISVSDRWAITAYIRALQLSQHARKEDVPPEEWAKLEGQSP